MIDYSTRVLINGREGRLSSIQNGDNITVVSVGDKAVQLIITSNNQSVSGTIRSIGKDTISVSVGTEVFRFDVTSATRIYRSGQRLSSLDELYMGEEGVGKGERI